MNVDKAVIKHNVNTGAEVTVISEAMWKTLNLSQPLQKPSSSLCGTDYTPMKILGEVYIPFSHIQRKMLHTTSLHGEEHAYAGSSSY